MRGLLIDLDGVVWEGEDAVPGAPEAVDWLQSNGLPYLFVTNTTSRPRRLIAAKLQQLGMPVTAEKILTPPVAACQWLASHSAGPLKLLVPDATREDFAKLTETTGDANDKVAAIVIGDIGSAWDYATLNGAFRMLMTEPAPALVALGMTRYWKAADGFRLDVAPFIKALEYAADCEAVVLGKPSADFFAIALRVIGCEPGETLMIGDDISGDVAGAQKAGLQAALVRTGKFRERDLHGRVRPDAVLSSIADLPEWWAQNA
ncbi:MAG: TIGR01458 family HAD-type hydrolase [Gammaproteobacteria bacterium]|jgi:phospholysine phosphohistidine inorganic pyrophosphate phosphatase